MCKYIIANRLGFENLYINIFQRLFDIVIIYYSRFSNSFFCLRFKLISFSSYHIIKHINIIYYVFSSKESKSKYLMIIIIITTNALITTLYLDWGFQWSRHSFFQRVHDALSARLIQWLSNTLHTTSGSQFTHVR